MTEQARKLSEGLMAALEYGVDMKNRRIFLHGDVAEETVGIAVRALYLLSSEDAKTPIELFVASYGGELDEAFALYDVTRTVTAPIHTVAIGKCMSAAPLMVACGQKGYRYATEHCLFMLHDCSLGYTEGSPEEIEAHTMAARQRMEAYAKILSRCTKKGIKFWREMMSGKADKFFSATQALDWGLIDQIWSEK